MRQLRAVFRLLMGGKGFFSRLPVLQTERLILRRVGVLDTLAVFDIEKDPEVRAVYRQAPMTSRLAALWMVLGTLAGSRMNAPTRWAVIEKQTNRMIAWGGFIKVHTPTAYEIGIRIARPSWGKGYGTEIVNAVANHGFAVLGLDRIIASIRNHNSASLHLFEKAGFVVESKDEVRTIKVLTRPDPG